MKITMIWRKNKNKNNLIFLIYLFIIFNIKSLYVCHNPY